MSDYYSNFNPTILELIDAENLTFCEFGCGAGALARAIKERNPLIRYAGVDIAATELSKAQHILDYSINLNIDACPFWEDSPQLLASRPAEGFDCIIFGDVLEHLYSPETAVDQAARWLRPGGSLIASIPTFSTGVCSFSLYAGVGPGRIPAYFDRTHIRWFALHDMHALFDHPLLSVDAVVPRVFQQEEGREVAEFLEPLALYQGVDPKYLSEVMLPLQYVFRVKRM